MCVCVWDEGQHKGQRQPSQPVADNAPALFFPPTRARTHTHTNADSLRSSQRPSTRSPTRARRRSRKRPRPRPRRRARRSPRAPTPTPRPKLPQPRRTAAPHTRARRVKRRAARRRARRATASFPKGRSRMHCRFSFFSVASVCVCVCAGDRVRTPFLIYSLEVIQRTHGASTRRWTAQRARVLKHGAGKRRGSQWSGQGRGIRVLNVAKCAGAQRAAALLSSSTPLFQTCCCGGPLPLDGQ